MTALDPILIIDDDVEYSCLLQVALSEAQIQNPICVINDPCAAVEYLRKLAMRPLIRRSGVPVLVLLELRMPKVSGLEVIRSIRSLPALAQMPIAVFTGVETAEERSQAIAQGATSLHLKPFSYRDLVLTAERLRDHYLGPTELVHAA